MYKLSVNVVPGDDNKPRYFQLSFGPEANPNILQFDTHSVGHGAKTKATDWNADTVEVVLASIPAVLLTDEKQRQDLEIAIDEEMPVLMTLIRAEGETRPLRVILDDLEAVIAQLPDTSVALAQIPRVMAEVKAIQFRAAESPEVEYPQYPRPLAIGIMYSDVDGQLVTIDLLAMDPKLSEDSIFEILLEFDEDASKPKYDYAILLQQLGGFVDDHYNTYHKPTEKLLGLLMQYGLVTPDTTLEAFIAKGIADAKSQSDSQPDSN